MKEKDRLLEKTEKSVAQSIANFILATHPKSLKSTREIFYKTDINIIDHLRKHGFSD
jgi:hypothetical protein